MFSEDVFHMLICVRKSISILPVLVYAIVAYAATVDASNVRIDASKVVSSYSNLASVVASESSVGKTIVVSSRQVLTGNLVIPETVRVRIASGGLIFHGPHTVTINGHFDAGAYHVFSGTGNVTFRDGSVKEIYPEWWGAKPDGITNCTTAIQAAINSGNSVRLSNGTYNTDTVKLKANFRLRGSGIGATTIKQNKTAGASYGTLFADSGNSGATVDNISLSDFSIDGSVVSKKFSEFEHLVSLNGVKNVVVERLKFLGFRGDGIILTSSFAGASERHNYNVIIKNCIFDGVNRDNRNGISIIDGNGIVIQNNYFLNCTRPNMPGAIDIEPDPYVYHVIKDIKIISNTFYNNGGTGGSISVYLPDVAYAVFPSGFLFEGNVIESTSISIDMGISFVHAGNADHRRNHNAKIVNNKLIKSARGFRLFGVSDMVIYKNIIDETILEPLIGYTGANNNINIRFISNVFKRIATRSGGGVAIFTIDHLLFDKNTFIDCGKSDGSGGYAIHFFSGTSTYVTLVNNIFESPNSITTFAIRKEPKHIFAPLTNKCVNNVLVGSVKGNSFQGHNDNE